MFGQAPGAHHSQVPDFNNDSCAARCADMQPNDIRADRVEWLAWSEGSSGNLVIILENRESLFLIFYVATGISCDQL